MAWKIEDGLGSGVSVSLFTIDLAVSIMKAEAKMREVVIHIEVLEEDGLPVPEEKFDTLIVAV